MPTALEAYRYGRIIVREFNVDVQAVAVGRAVYFPLRPLVEALGLSRQAQIRKMREDSRFADAFRLLPVPTDRGLRDAWCINKRAVSIWLASLDPARCSLKVRPAVERFQAALFAAADRFLFGDTRRQSLDPDAKSTVFLTGQIAAGPAPCPLCGGHLCVTLDLGEGDIHLTPADAIE